ncbi:MAG: chaperone modulator CbpM [Gammaproteobacteria bacterium]
MKEQMVEMTGTLMDEHIRFTLLEICRLGKTSAEQVIEMVEEGILEPEGVSAYEWRFDAVALKRLQIALRLQRDLKINLPGTALVLDLLEEMEELRSRLGS